MTKEAAELEFDNFYNLTYSKRLNYWNTSGKAFYFDTVELKVDKKEIEEDDGEDIDTKPRYYPYDEFDEEFDEEEELKFYQQEFAEYPVDSDNLVLSIRPNGQEERLAYNKWIIDCWREVFKKEKYRITTTEFQPIYKYSDDLINNFRSLIRKKSLVHRENIINNELSTTNQFIKNLKVKDVLVERIYSLMSSGWEGDVYHDQIVASSTLITLRQIAKIWDRLKYKVFLENETMLPPDKKNRLESIKPIEMKGINDDQLRALFDRLLRSHFIHGDSKYMDFKHVILQSPLDKIPKLKWIDIADNKEVNKITLIELFDHLVLGKTEMKNLFMTTHFNTYTEIKEQEITRESLNQSRKQMRQQKAKSARQMLILTLLNTAEINSSQ